MVVEVAPGALGAVAHAPLPAPAVIEPRWLRALALAGALGVAAFGSVGLVLAVLGHYRPLVAFGGGALVFAAAIALARPVITVPGRSDRAANAVALAGVVCILGLSVWNVSHHSEHVLINRDGGSYANTGRWLASQGTLEVDVSSDPFADEPAVRLRSHAVYRTDDDTLTFQFAHMLPVLLAEAHRLGGDELMFRVPAILGGLSLLGFFVLAWRLFKAPLFALAATLALGLTIPQVSFARDTYSEIPSQVLLFAGLWLLTSPSALCSWRVAFIAGALLGTIQTVRVDGLVLLLGLPLALAFFVATAPRELRPTFVRGAAACLAGILPGLALGNWDATSRSPGYLADLWPEVRQLIVAFVGAILVSAVVVACAASRRAVISRGMRDFVARVGAPVVALVAIGAGFAAWFVRPHVQEYTSTAHGWLGGLQQLDGVASPDTTRRFYERSMEWMSWYLGPATVAVAIVALGFVLGALLRGRRRLAVPALALLGPATVHYLWHAHASPDHIWVMRRFLTSALPLFVLLALGLAAALSKVSGRPRRAALAGAITIAVMAVASPIAAVAPVAEMSEQEGFIAPILSTCEAVGPDTAVLVLQTPGRIFHELIPQTIRSWCDLPVANMPAPLDAAVIRDLAAEWEARGRTLYVAADAPETITALIPDTGVVEIDPVFSEHMLQETIVKRPHEFRVQELRVFVASVAPAI